MDNKVTIYSFFCCPNLLDFSLLSLHQVQLAGREELSGRGDSSGAREKLPRCLEGKAEVWTLPRLFSISKDVRWERKWRVWRDGRMARPESMSGTGWERRVLPHQETWPRPRVGAFSYRLVMPCHRHCSPACPGIYLLLSLVHCFLQKPPERPQRSLSPSSLIEKSFLAGSCQERNDLGLGE